MVGYSLLKCTGSYHIGRRGSLTHAWAHVIIQDHMVLESESDNDAMTPHRRTRQLAAVNMHTHATA